MRSSERRAYEVATRFLLIPLTVGLSLLASCTTEDGSASPSTTEPAGVCGTQHLPDGLLFIMGENDSQASAYVAEGCISQSRKISRELSVDGIAARGDTAALTAVVGTVGDALFLIEGDEVVLASGDPPERRFGPTVTSNGSIIYTTPTDLIPQESTTVWELTADGATQLWVDPEKITTPVSGPTDEFAYLAGAHQKGPRRLTIRSRNGAPRELDLPFEAGFPIAWRSNAPALAAPDRRDKEPPATALIDAESGAILGKIPGWTPLDWSADQRLLLTDGEGRVAIARSPKWQAEVVDEGIGVPIYLAAWP